MVVATAAAATRSFLRSSLLSRTAWRYASRSKPSTSSFRSSPSPKPLSRLIFRSPVELSVFLETMQPYHSVTASALMISKLTGTYCGVIDNTDLCSSSLLGEPPGIETEESLLEDYLQCHSCPVEDESPGDQRRVQWTAPAAGVLKLNVDAAWSGGRAGYGCVLRDCRGRVVASAAGPLNQITSAEHAELMAIWCSFQTLRQLLQRRVTIESDCLPVVAGLHARHDQNSTTLGSIYDMVKRECLTDGQISVSYQCRSANLVAHRLAGIGRLLRECVTWMRSSHPSVLNVLNADWIRINI